MKTFQSFTLDIWRITFTLFTSKKLPTAISERFSALFTAVGFVTRMKIDVVPEMMFEKKLLSTFKTRVISVA